MTVRVSSDKRIQPQQPMALVRLTACTTFLLFGAFLPITQGVYLYDFIVVAMVSFGLLFPSTKRVSGIRMSKLVLPFGLLCLFTLGSLLMQLDFFESSTTIWSFYYLIKIITLWVYLLYFDQIDDVQLNPTLISAFISFPIIQSLWIYYYPQFDFLEPLREYFLISEDFGMVPRQIAGRYTGVFSDVNSLGSYCGIALLYVLIVGVKKKLFPAMAGVCLIITFMGIVLSGMRTSLIGILICGVVLAYINTWRTVMVATVGGLALVTVFPNLLDVWDLRDYVEDRFSFIRFSNDLGVQGNLGQAIDYFYQVFSGIDLRDPLVWLVGYDSGVIYVDSLFGSLFGQFGLIGVVIFAFFIWTLFREFWKHSRSRMLLLPFVYTFVISIKGLFALANWHLFLFTLVIFESMHITAKSGPQETK